VRSSIIAATFRVNDRPNAKPNPDASSRSPADPAPRGRLDAGHAFLVFDRRDEAIPATWDGFDVLRSGRGIAERFAQPLDGRVHAVLEVDEGVVGPEPLAQFLARHDAPRASEQCLQNRERLFREVGADAILPDLPAVRIQLDRTDRDASRAGWSLSHSSPPESGILTRHFQRTRFYPEPIG